MISWNALRTFGAMALTAIVLDFLWLANVASSFYLSRLGEWIRRGPGGKMMPIFWAAGVVYILIPLGVGIFVLPQVLKAGSGSLATRAWILGAIFGGVLYGVYDFTNYCLIERWPLSVALVDFAWGCFLCAAVTWVGALVSSV